MDEPLTEPLEPQDLPVEYASGREPWAAPGAAAVAEETPLVRPSSVERAAPGPAPGWQFFYSYGADPSDSGVQERYGAGVRAYKQALIDNGHGQGIVVTLPKWGGFARERTVAFQNANGLDADGVVGPRTARALLRMYVERWERQYTIPGGLLGKLGTLESNNHAVAQGWADPDDEGWAQIHLPFYPKATREQAWDPAWAISWTAGQLWSTRMHLGDWDAAVVAHNVGYSTAKDWLAQGKMQSGGPVWHTPQGEVDSFTRAFTYLTLVKQA